MAVICEHCKKPIESKSDLIVMRQWWLFPKALHKSCWGDLAMSHGGVGSVSYQTGALRGRRQYHIPINSAFFTIIAIIALLIGIFILFVDFSGGTVTASGVERAPTLIETLGIKAVLFLVFLIPMIQRIWSSSKIESQLS